MARALTFFAAFLGASVLAARSADADAARRARYALFTMLGKVNAEEDDSGFFRFTWPQSGPAAIAGNVGRTFMMWVAADRNGVERLRAESRAFRELAPGVLPLAAMVEVAARMMRVALWLVVVACIAISEASAMMSPEEYRAARDAASHWLQLRIDAVKAPRKLPGVCIVRGEVMRVFRGPPPAAKTIDLEVECKSRGQRSPPGDEFKVDIEDLLTGRYVEAFVDAREGRYVVAARQIEFVANPGATPAFTGKE